MNRLARWPGSARAPPGQFEHLGHSGEAAYKEPFDLLFARQVRVRRCGGGGERTRTADFYDANVRFSGL